MDRECLGIVWGIKKLLCTYLVNSLLSKLIIAPYSS